LFSTFCMAKQKSGLRGGGGGSPSAKKARISTRIAESSDDEILRDADPVEQIDQKESEFVSTRSLPVREVLFVDGIKDPLKYSRIALRNEMLKFFPDVKCKAFFIRNSGLRIFAFEKIEDLEAMASKNWNEDFGDLGAPFGGVGRVSRRREGRVGPGVSGVGVSGGSDGFAVRLRIDSRITEEEFKTQLSEQGFGDHTFNFVRRSDGRFFGTVKLIFSVESDCQRAVERGVCVGYSCVRGEHWAVGSRAVQCYRCLGFGHFRAMCRVAVRCAKCAGAHDIRSCDSSTVSCANCAGTHFAWSDSCEASLAARRAAAVQLGFSSRSSVSVGTGVSGGARGSGVPGARSFASVLGGGSGGGGGGGGGGGSGIGQAGTPGAGVSTGMAQELARHVVSFLADSFRKLVDVLVSAFLPVSSSSSGTSSSRESCPSVEPVSGTSVTLFRILSALQLALSSVADPAPNG
jgi:hypothetical protein